MHHSSQYSIHVPIMSNIIHTTSVFYTSLQRLPQYQLTVKTPHVATRDHAYRRWQETLPACVRKGGQGVTVVRISMIVQWAHVLMEGHVKMSWMDSHAPVLLHGLVQYVSKVGLCIYVATVYGCQVLLKARTPSLLAMNNMYIHDWNSSHVVTHNISVRKDCNIDWSVYIIKQWRRPSGKHKFDAGRKFERLPLELLPFEAIRVHKLANNETRIIIPNPDF